jgi:hypothetical protein
LADIGAGVAQLVTTLQTSLPVRVRIPAIPKRPWLRGRGVNTHTHTRAHTHTHTHTHLCVNAREGGGKGKSEKKSDRQTHQWMVKTKLHCERRYGGERERSARAGHSESEARGILPPAPLEAGVAVRELAHAPAALGGRGGSLPTPATPRSLPKPLRQGWGKRGALRSVWRGSAPGEPPRRWRRGAPLTAPPTPPAAFPDPGPLVRAEGHRRRRQVGQDGEWVGGEGVWVEFREVGGW